MLLHGLSGLVHRGVLGDRAAAAAMLAGLALRLGQSDGAGHGRRRDQRQGGEPGAAGRRPAAPPGVAGPSEPAAWQGLACHALTRSAGARRPAPGARRLC